MRRDQWVREYKVTASVDGRTWFAVDEVFEGNFDRDTKVRGTFSRPVRARYVRISPTLWKTHMSMRAGLTICLPKSCETEAVKKHVESASSSHSSCRQGGALDGRDGWCSNVLKAGHFYQMDAGSVMSIAGVVTQGRHLSNQWVTTYKVQVSQDAEHWWQVGNIYQGNTNRDGKVTHTFSKPVTARYLRVLPQTWNGHMSMRAGMVVCTGALAQPGCQEKNVNRERHGQTNSQYDHAKCKEGALDSKYGWCGKELKLGNWYQMDAGTIANISGVVTQGRHDA